MIYLSILLLSLIYAILITVLTLYVIGKINVFWSMFPFLFSCLAWILFIKILKTDESKFEKQFIRSYFEEI